MSKQVGLIRLKGNLGGISFYRSGGEDLARSANGPSKERIESDPAFVRTRENNREFGGSSSTAKAFRLAFAEVIQTMGDRYLASRLTRTFKEINLRGMGARGQRSIALSANRMMLVNMEFNRSKAFSSVCNVPYSITHNTERTEVSVSFPGFLPQNFIDAPAGATHFAMVLAIGVVSDYVFDNGLNNYVPFDPEVNMLGDSDRSATMGVMGAASSIILNAALPSGTPTLGNEVSVVVALGIEFYQRVGGQDYLFAQGASMRVADVI